MFNSLSGKSASSNFSNLLNNKLVRKKLQRHFGQKIDL